MVHKFSFLDTNTFLHFPSIEQIDWLKHLSAKRVTLVVAVVVLRELNKRKDALGSPKKIRKRASLALKTLRRFLKEGATEVRPAVELQFRPNDPVFDFGSHGLTRELSDDYLLASILKFRQENPEAEIVLITQDMGLEVKAHEHSIQVLELPEKLRLPEEMDQDEKYMKELEEKVRRYERRMPDLKLVFQGGGDRFRVSLPQTGVNQDVIRDNIRRGYPPLKKAGGYSGADLFRGTVVSPGQIDEYNKRIETFYAEYEVYLQALDEYMQWRQRVIPLNIVLHNDGTCPAQSVDILMYLPDAGLKLLQEDDLVEPPAEPEAPERPKTFSEMMTTVKGAIEEFGKGPYISPEVMRSLRSPVFHPAQDNVSRLSIKKIKSYEVCDHVMEVKHKLSEDLEPLYILIDSLETARSLTIEYSIHANNVPDKVEGELHVIVEK